MPIKQPLHLAPKEKDVLTVRVNQVFSPNSPISSRDLFSGRQDQIHSLLDAVFQNGLHVIVFGERGVGKTSLVKVLPAFIEAAELKDVLVFRVPASEEDDSDSLWKKMFSQIEVGPENNRETIAKKIGKQKITTYLIHQEINAIVSEDHVLVLIFDEIDVIKDSKTKRVFAETIKSLSDDSVNATIVLVGVAENVKELVAEHESIGRNLTQISMPRMSADEAKEILILKGLDKLNMGIEDECLDKIIKICQGLPHYLHLLGRNSAREAVSESLRNVSQKHVDSAIQKSLDQAHQSTKDAYMQATDSPRKNLYKEVLLSCALADADEMNKFAAGDMADPFRKITKNKSYGIGNYAKSLSDLCSPKRGRILIKSGEKRGYRYKFSDPLMPSYLIMRGLKEDLIDKTLLNDLS